MKKNVLNTVLVVLAYVAPLYFLYSYQDEIIQMKKIQVPLLAILFFGSIILSYINWKKEEPSWTHWFFKILGILGFLYSGAILLLLYSFRNGIGF